MGPAQDDNAITAGAETPEIARLKEDVRREHESYLRALADFENYRRRVDRERASAAYSGRREILRSLLEVLDNFELALQHADAASPSFEEGWQAIHRKLLGLLEAQGVTPLVAVGEAFDPELHEAIGTVTSENYQPGTVAQEVQRGYRLGEDLLRPARVLVAQ